MLRLHGAITSALASVSEDQAVMAAEALGITYTSLRAEVRAIVPDGLTEEFERLFSPQVPGARARGPMGDAKHFSQARAALGAMAGWLDGFIREARMRAEVEAYAKERVKAERGVGFKPS